MAIVVEVMAVEVEVEVVELVEVEEIVDVGVGVGWILIFEKVMLVTAVVGDGASRV